MGRFEWNPKTINRPVGAKASILLCNVETPLASATTEYPFGLVSVMTFHQDDDDDEDERSDLSTTTSHPSCFAASTLDVRPTTPTTGFNCNNFDICTIILPTPPAAECMSMDLFLPAVECVVVEDVSDETGNA